MNEQKLPPVIHVGVSGLFFGDAKDKQELPPVICQPPSSEPYVFGRIWKTLIAINLALGLMFWFGCCTDYLWASQVANVFFPPAVAAIAWRSLRSFLATGQCRNKRSKRLYALACMPSLVGGGIATMLGLILVMFYVLCIFLAHDFQAKSAGTTLIQSAESPNRARIASVYGWDSGARSDCPGDDHVDRSGGPDMIFVRVRHRGMPFVEREVYYNSGFIRSDCLSWKDNNTLCIREPARGEREVKLGMVGRGNLDKLFAPAMELAAGIMSLL